MAGAIFGEIGVIFFVAGTAFREILGDSRNAKCCFFSHAKCISKMGRVRSPKRRVPDNDFIVGISSNRLYIGGSNAGILRLCSSN